MNRALGQEIVACLGVAGSAEQHLLNLRNFLVRDWEASLDWLNLSGIALLFWDRLQTYGAEGAVPPKVGAALAANIDENRRRVAVMRQEFASLNGQFERAGIHFAVWKGFALIPDYCPDACLRVSYDYDYLISQDTWGGAQEVLEAAGYTAKPDAATQLRITFAPRRLSSHRSPSTAAFYAPDLARKVELHLSVWDEAAIGIPMEFPERPLDRKVLRRWQGLSFYSLDDRDAFVFQAMHTFQHILHNWCRLGWLLEIAYFLENRSTDSPFWTRLDAYLENNARLREVVALVVSLAAHLFHTPIPAPIKDQIPGALRGAVALWLDQYGLRSALDNFSENKYALFLYREFVRDERVWREIRTRRLLPLHRPNRVAEAVAPSAPALLPESWNQPWYVLQRLIHHSVKGAAYAWESARWDRMRRLSAGRVPQ